MFVFQILTKECMDKYRNKNFLGHIDIHIPIGTCCCDDPLPYTSIAQACIQSTSTGCSMETGEGRGERERERVNLKKGLCRSSLKTKGEEI